MQHQKDQNGIIIVLILSPRVVVILRHLVRFVYETKTKRLFLILVSVLCLVSTWMVLLIHKIMVGERQTMEMYVENVVSVILQVQYIHEIAEKFLQGIKSHDELLCQRKCSERYSVPM